jgi:signal peptidase I
LGVLPCVALFLWAGGIVSDTQAMLAFGAYCVLEACMLADSFRTGSFTTSRTMMLGSELLLMLLIPAAFIAGFRSFKVASDGMAPTLLGERHGTPDRVVCDRLRYLLAAPRRGDVVLFRTDGIVGLPAGSTYVKRLVGLPGESIEIHDGHVFADGRQLGPADGIPDLPYCLPSHMAIVSRFRPMTGPFRVPPDGCFVLGDNTSNSLDSRYWGAVPRRNLLGRVTRIYYPLSRRAEL